MEDNKQRSLQIKASDADLKGSYANGMQVMHTKEEFILDFMNMFPPAGTLNARVIVSPGHCKRMVAVLSARIKQYEKQFGEIEVAKAPVSPSDSIGFQEREDK